MVNLILVVSLVFALIVAIFAVQNNTAVDISFLGWTYSNISLVLVIIGSAVAGAVSVFLFSVFKQLKMRIELRQLKSMLDRSKREGEGLKTEIETLKTREKEQSEADAGESGQQA